MKFDALLFFTFLLSSGTVKTLAEQYFYCISYQRVRNRSQTAYCMIVCFYIVDTNVYFWRFHSLLQEIHSNVTTKLFFFPEAAYTLQFIANQYLTLWIWQRCMSNFQLKCARFYLRPFLCTAWEVVVGGEYRVVLLSTCAACFVWKCEKSERLKM